MTLKECFENKWFLCLSQAWGPGFPHHISWVFCVCFVDIGGIINNHFLNFFFIICLKVKYLKIWLLIKAAFDQKEEFNVYNVQCCSQTFTGLQYSQRHTTINHCDETYHSS
jgi:hypothetical protein